MVCNLYIRMEKALFISKTAHMKYINPQYDRLYFGNEFCQRLIPSVKDLGTVKKLVLERQMGFTLVTPYVTNRGIDLLKPVFEYVLVNFPEAEVVINDWGVLRLVKREFKSFNLNLGRLLVKQKRGPRILNIEDKVPSSLIQHFKEVNMDAPVLGDFLTNNGFKRIELDNLLQGIDRQGCSLKGSLYFPFAYVTTTRFCLSAGCKKNESVLRSICDCDKECQKYTFRLKHKTMPVDLLLKGNTKFFRNDVIPDNLKELNIDRIVHEPEIPL